MKLRSTAIAGLLIPAILAFQLSPPLALAGDTTVTLPITLNSPILESLIIHNLYTGKGGSAIALDEDGGCRKIVLSDPSVSFAGRFTMFETRVRIRAGQSIAGLCLAPITWEGYLRLKQTAYLGAKSWTLRFKTVDSNVYDIHHEPTVLTGIFYRFIKDNVESYLSRLSISLEPPVSNLKDVIAPLFPPGLRSRGVKLVHSFRPGGISVTRAGLKVGILADVEETAARPESVEPLSGDEMKTLMKTWETWDSFLAYLIIAMSDKPLTDSDRQTLLDTLLETRYAFINGLDENSLNKDFVREQFVSAWNSLSPIFRKHLAADPGQSLLGYLSFFTASDALATLDKIGPTLGMEISRNGIIRLFKLLGGKSERALAYQPGVSAKLRKALGLGAPPAEGEIGIDGDFIDIDQPGNPPLSLLRFFYGDAWASARRSSIDLKEIRKWIVTRKNYDDYLKKVRALLTEVGGDSMKRTGIGEERAGVYHKLVMSTAWQESCFRQFKVVRKKLTYLRSYNRSSVGLMQVNERAWRGVYDRSRLRWDIRYNASAGTEIIGLYMRRHALRKMKEGFDEATLARAVYAMYNGGPRQLKKFLRRHKTGSYYKSDRLFYKKYQWVEKGDWDRLRSCLFGE